jgi:hypothetical protein
MSPVRHARALPTLRAGSRRLGVRQEPRRASVPLMGILTTYRQLQVHLMVQLGTGAHFPAQDSPLSSQIFGQLALAFESLPSPPNLASTSMKGPPEAPERSPLAGLGERGAALLPSNRQEQTDWRPGLVVCHSPVQDLAPAALQTPGQFLCACISVQRAPASTSRSIAPARVGLIEQASAIANTAR